MTNPTSSLPDRVLRFEWPQGTRPNRMWLGFFSLLALSSAAFGDPTLSRAAARLGLPPLHVVDTGVAESAAARIGARLFSDARLSADGKVSCAKCHSPQLAFSEGRARSLGHEGQQGTRNAPSLLNVAFLQSLFWDGRETTLESQALAPLTNPVEHALTNNEAVLEIVRRDPSYVRDFSNAFRVSADSLGVGMVAQALAAYERTLLSAGSPFDRFLYGGEATAMSAAAIRGLELFRGRAQCASCHTIGPSYALFTDGQFHASPTGLPAAVSANLAHLAKRVADAAKVGGRPILERLIASDPEVAALGRFVVTLNPIDVGKFRTPSLRNVVLTGPYMHDGSVATLERAVDLELYNRASGVSYPIILTVAERGDLIEFLSALTSP